MIFERVARLLISATLLAVVDRPDLVAAEAPSSTVLTSSANPSHFTLPLTFTATTSLNVGQLSSSPIVIPTLGTVTFFDGNNTLGSCPVALTGIATFSSPTLAVGVHQITASYSGDANLGGSKSNVVSQNILKGDAKITLTSNANPAILSNSVTFTATILSPPGTAVGGIVAFRDGPNFIGTGTPDDSGVVTLATSTLSLGTHTIRATYAGNSNFNGPISATLLQQVFPANSIVPTDNSGGVSPAPAAGRFAVSSDGAANTPIRFGCRRGAPASSRVWRLRTIVDAKMGCSVSAGFSRGSP
jgi:large repetitive protein